MPTVSGMQRGERRVDNQVVCRCILYPKDLAMKGRVSIIALFGNCLNIPILYSWLY